MFSMLIKVGGLLIVAALAALLSANWAQVSGKARQEPVPAHSLQQGIQPGGDPPLQLQGAYSRLLQPQTWAGSVFPEPLGRMAGVRLHMCPQEDGDPSTRPCVWQDPDTDRIYYVDSTEYLD